MADTETPKATILVVDDERDHAQVMCEALARLGHKCDVTYSLPEAMSRLDRKRYDVVVTDLVMDGRRDGLDLLAASKRQHPPPPVLLVSAHGDIPTAVKAMNEGAFNFIEKPLDLEHFRALVNRAAEHSALERQNQALQAQVIELEGQAGQGGFEGIIGTSPAMQQVVRTARQVAQIDLPILVLGESGTGKELIARAIHNNSKRRKERMVALNCAGFAPTILEDELFGHVKGAFTDARTDRPGRFEHADGGTLFLDEIGDMPHEMQAKLLRTLESGEVVRLGANEPIHVDVRLISATNKNLDEMVAGKKFREDLYSRIRGVTILIPPLRDRREDIPLLTHYFIQQAADKYGKVIDGIDPEAQRVLMGHGWPGNVRQLRNAVELMVALVPDHSADDPSSPGARLGPENIPPDLRPASGEPTAGLSGL